jgi:hypothetical protein
VNRWILFGEVFDSWVFYLPVLNSYKNGWIFVNNESKIMRREAIVTYFKVPSEWLAAFRLGSNPKPSN